MSIAHVRLAANRKLCLQDLCYSSYLKRSLLRTSCFDNGSFVTRLIAVKYFSCTKCLSHGILSVVKLHQVLFAWVHFDQYTIVIWPIWGWIFCCIGCFLVVILAYGQLLNVLFERWNLLHGCVPRSTSISFWCSFLGLSGKVRSFEGDNSYGCNLSTVINFRYFVEHCINSRYETVWRNHYHRIEPKIYVELVLGKCRQELFSLAVILSFIRIFAFEICTMKILMICNKQLLLNYWRNFELVTVTI